MHRNLARFAVATSLAFTFSVPFIRTAGASAVPPARAPLLLSIANPPSGTPINLKRGQASKINVHGINSCTFDYSTMVTTGGIIGIDNPTGSGEKTVNITFLATSVGSTTLTIMTNNGSCPPAIHTYPVTVAQDIPGMLKSFTAESKADLKDWKLEIKADYTNWLTLSKAKYTDILAGTVAYDQGISDLRDITNNSVWMMHMHASTRLDNFGDFGSTLIAGNVLSSGDAPSGMFPGGCGPWDQYEAGICGEIGKTMGTLEKTAKGYLTGFAKAGKPTLQVPVFCFPKIYSTGPLYADQTSTTKPLQYPQFTLVYSYPTTNLAGDNGKISVTGYTDSAYGANIDLELVKQVNLLPDSTTTFSAPVSGWGFTHEFTGLTPGAYKVLGRYTGDIVAIGGVVYVDKQ
jgi:hypothetical protein